jgi:hypothetical protein
VLSADDPVDDRLLVGPEVVVPEHGLKHIGRIGAGNVHEREDGKGEKDEPFVYG